MQWNLETFERKGIKVFAISPDSQSILQKFAAKYDINYPLLSDQESRVISELGILNTHIPHEHEWYGVPYPGFFMVDRNGIVFEKSFINAHWVRESVDNVLRNDFRVDDLDIGEFQTITTPYLEAKAYFTSRTARIGQLSTLVIEISLADGVHVLGTSLPEGFVPLELYLDADSGVRIERVNYPTDTEFEIAGIGEKLSVYYGQFQITASCLIERDGIREALKGGDEQDLNVNGALRLQACDETQCYLPETLRFTFPLRLLHHDWQEFDE